VERGKHEPTPPGPPRWFFDVWSLIYDLPLVQRATYWPVHDAVITALRGKACGRVLDVGCGTGQLSSRIRRELPRSRVVGCDFSSGMLRRAAQRGGAAWVQADAGRLPFASGSFDAVVSTEAFHWFPDQHAALIEFHRVLARGGQLLLALVNPPSELVSEAAHFGSRLFGEPFYWPTIAQMRERVEAAGFRVEWQERVFRLPGALLLPPVLTVAVASRGQRGATARSRRRTRRDER